MIDIYVFSSANLTNIWAGVGSHLWAVSLDQARNKSIQGKARKLPIGGTGIFYCVQEKALTTPFLIRSKPDADAEIAHVWPERWALPFRIVPLGSPARLLSVLDLKSKLPLGTPQDITLQELRIECFFPMDEPTATVFRSWAAEGSPQAS